MLLSILTACGSSTTVQDAGQAWFTLEPTAPGGGWGVTSGAAPFALDSADTGDSFPPITPMADIASDQSGVVGDTLTFDGSGSFDPDGGDLTYAWTLTRAPAPSALTSGDLSGRYGDTASLVVDEAGDYGLALVVTSSTGQESRAYYATGTVAAGANTAPVADAGDDVTALYGHFVNLLGTRTQDADGDALTYAWSFVSVPAASALTAADWFTDDLDHAAFMPDAAGDYEIQVVVDDGTATDVDTTVVTVLAQSGNTAPCVDVGPPQIAAIGDTVTIDGSASYDPDDEPITAWAVSFSSVPADSARVDADITGATTQSASFVADVAGDFTLSVSASDGSDTQTVDLLVTVETAGSPTAGAGSDQDVPLGVDITLYSSARHSRGETLSLAWTLDSAPSGSARSTSDIGDATSSEASFSPDVVGDYTFSLQASDADETATDSVTMTVF